MSRIQDLLLVTRLRSKFGSILIRWWHSGVSIANGSTGDLGFHFDCAHESFSPLSQNSTHCWSAFELVTTNTLSREREREKVGGGAVFPNWGKTPLARKQLENVKQLIAFGKELLWNPVFLVRGPNSEGSKEKRSKLKSSFCLSIRPPTPTSKNRIESFCSIWGKNGHRAKKKRRCLREVSFRNAHPPVALDLGLGRENFAGKTPASRWK